VYWCISGTPPGRPRSVVEGHRAERHIAAGDALRHAQHVGHHVPVVDAEHRARAAEADMTSSAIMATSCLVQISRIRASTRRAAQKAGGASSGSAMRPLCSRASDAISLEEAGAAHVDERILKANAQR